jgi:hypothetical protein
VVSPKKKPLAPATLQGIGDKNGGFMGTRQSGSGGPNIARQVGRGSEARKAAIQELAKKRTSSRTKRFPKASKIVN